MRTYDEQNDRVVVTASDSSNLADALERAHQKKYEAFIQFCRQEEVRIL